MRTEIVKVNPDYPELEKLVRCAKIIRQGGLVIFPTETVYGIAADYNNPKAMERLRQTKGRSETKPFSIHISQKELLLNYSSVTDPTVFKLIDHYWPGPLTVVVPSQDPGKTIGIRMPDHNIALRLAQLSQCTMASPSANLQGHPPPSSCEEALRDLDGLVDIAIDGGLAKFGLASSVVDFTQPKPAVIRPGVITQQDVDRITQRKTVLFVCTGNSCRSVMAEYILKAMTAGRCDVEVYSAGTGVFLQSTASAETIMSLKKMGIDATAHQSQPVNNVLLHKSDLILVMTRRHRQQVLERVPEVEKRVYLLKEFVNVPIATEADMDIPDPMGKTHQDYEDCILTIKDAISKLVKLI